MRKTKYFQYFVIKNKKNVRKCIINNLFCVLYMNQVKIGSLVYCKWINSLYNLLIKTIPFQKNVFLHSI